MSDKFQKIIGAGVLGIVLIIVKTVGKNADNLVKHVDGVIPNVVKVTERELPNAATHSTRIIARQYLKDDNVEGVDNLDWSNNEYRDYFISDLGKISKQISSKKSKDTLYSKKIQRNYNWLYSNCLNNEADVNTFFKILKDSSNSNLQNGAKYFIRLYTADSYIKYDKFKENYLDNEDFKSFKKWEKKNILKNSEKITETLSEFYYKTGYFPFHDDLAKKIMSDLIISKK